MLHLLTLFYEWEWGKLEIVTVFLIQHLKKSGLERTKDFCDEKPVIYL